jgi:hypothetical protein
MERASKSNYGNPSGPHCKSLRARHRGGVPKIEKTSYCFAIQVVRALLGFLQNPTIRREGGEDRGGRPEILMRRRQDSGDRT